jgi:outer membrane receptor protein involved in Fe transport
MQRSKKRKALIYRSVVARAPLASAIMLALSPAYAQQVTGLEEVVVTAQKRTESLQDVALSIQAIGAKQLEELRIANFADYAKFLPSLSYQNGGQSGGPGFSKPYMRGVANGAVPNHSGSLPSVGTYLDEQPITTINGALDVHIYDIARVEVLAGPQGTLYGASSQAGTIRIITNKPDPSGFAAGYDLEGSTVAKGETGYLAEGFVNLPISDTAAVRLVGWVRHDAGFIDNVPGTVTYPTSDITIDNSSRAKKDYNDGDTYGARAALKIDLNDTWAMTVGAMGQKGTTNGTYGYRTGSDLTITRFNPEDIEDRWYQAALTIEGKLGNFDVTYAGAYLDRKDETRSDYVDYSYYYDACCGYGSYIYDDNGELIDPTQYILGTDKYTKQSHELRISSPAENRLRFVAGLFTQRQTHDILQNYKINGIAGPSAVDPTLSIEVTGWPDTWWLTNQVRVDRDDALFGEVTFDLTDKLSLTGGIRFFEADNSIVGFLGFGLTNGFTSGTGEKGCATPTVPSVNGGPCTNVDERVKDSGNTPKVNLTYRFDSDRLVYATYSEGFRPGGINRRLSFPPYKPDFLTNYEIGWKTSWADSRLRFNGAVFFEDWKDFQFGYLGENSLTQIVNAGNANIRGLEADLTWAASDRFLIGGGVAYIDSELTEGYCGFLDANRKPETRIPCPSPAVDSDGNPILDTDGNPIILLLPPQAPKGTQLPVTAKFKANLTGRYTFNLGGFDAHLQAAVVYVGSRWPDLRTTLVSVDGASFSTSPGQRYILGEEPSYTVVDFTAGLKKDNYSAELFINNAFDKRAQLDRWAQCDAAVCGVEGTYITPTIPRTIGLRFGQKF